MLTELNTFLSRISVTQKIQLPRLNSYLSNIANSIRSAIITSNTNNPIPSNGLDFLFSIISTCDIRYLLKFRNDFERFIKLNNEYNNNLSIFIKNLYPIKTDFFISSSKHKCLEYMIITEDFDIVNNIPFNNDDFNRWKKVKPLSLVYNTSNDLNLNMITSKFKYNDNSPTEVLFSVDIIKLIMMYTKYCILFNDQISLAKNDIYPFLFKTCLLPLIYDNFKAYIMQNIYNKMINTMIYRNDYKWTELEVSLNINNALLDIDKFIDNNDDPNKLLVSMSVSKDISLYDIVMMNINKYNVCSYYSRNYKWIEFLKEYYILTILISCYKIYPDSIQSKEFFKHMNIIINRYNAIKFWDNATYPFIIKNIKNKFEAICDLTE